MHQHVQAGTNGIAALQSTNASRLSAISSTSVESPLRLNFDAFAVHFRHQHCVEFVTRTQGHDCSLVRIDIAMLLLCAAC